MKSFYVSYYGGASGDFLAFLIASGDSSVNDITYNDDVFSVLYNNGKHIKIGLNEYGAIKGSWQFSKISMRYRKYLFNDELKNLLLTNTVEYVVQKLENLTEDFDVLHLNDFEITAGHEIIVFSDAYDNTVEFEEFYKRNNFDNVVLLTMNEDKSKQITYLNSKYKNGNVPLHSIEYSSYPKELQYYSDIMNRIDCNKIEVVDLYDKEKLRKIIRSLTRKQWNDRFYDFIFDIYMSKQQLKDIL